MKKYILFWWTDVALLISFLLTGLIGLLRFILVTFYDVPTIADGLNKPSAGGGTRTTMNDVLPFEMPIEPSTMVAIHDWAGMVMVVLVGVHLWVHRKWIFKTTPKVLLKKKNLNAPKVE